MFLSLFLSVTSALVSTLIQQWAREYLQYSQPSAAPHKRGRVRTYLFDGLSQFQMRRLTYGVPVLLHLSVFLFFFALSEWLYSINTAVGATARYCLIALLAVYMALSILPLIVRNAPYQTALTTPLQAIISFIHVSYLALLRLMRGSTGVCEVQKGSGLFSRVHVDRARALMKEIEGRASKLDRSAMHWLLQELDDDNMDTFLSGLPGYIHSPLNTKPVVEGLRDDGVPGRIREHFTTCVTSVELSQEESMSRASSCINSLRLISETSTSATLADLENDDIQKIMEYLESLCYISNSKTALRALCIRSLVIREFLFPLAHKDTEELLTRKFPSHLTPLYRVIRLWKTTEIAQWSHLVGALPATADLLPSDQEMWSDVLCDGPLINLAVLAYSVLSHLGEEEINLDMAWKTLATLLKALGLAQVRASILARERFDQVLLMARTNSGKHEGLTQITPLLEGLDTVTSGLYLAEVFSYLPNPKLPPRRIEAIFGKEQLRDSELLEAFAAHLPGFINTNALEASTSFMERLILEHKLWEQLHVSLSKCFHPQVPFPDKLRIVMSFVDILDVAFVFLKDSSKIDWQSTDFELLIGHLDQFAMTIVPGMLIGQVASFRANISGVQFCHALLAQFSMQRSRRAPLITYSLNGLTRLVLILGVGNQEDREYLTSKAAKTNPNLMIKAEAILSVVLRDGPLSNFCTLGRMTFEEMLREPSELSSEDINRSWALLRRMLDTAHLPLVNASGGMWAKFDHLRAAVRGTVASDGSGSNAEKLQPLVEIIEEVNCMRPTTGDRAEGTGNGFRSAASVIQDARQPTDAPIPGSSRRADDLYQGLETGGSWNPGHFPHIRGAIPAAEMGPSAPGAWIPHFDVDPNVMGGGQPPTPSILPTQPGPGAGIPYPFPLLNPQVYPSGFSPPHAPGMSGPRRAGPFDVNDFPVHGDAQPVPSGVSIPPGYMPPHPYPPPFLNSGPFAMPPLGHVNQDSPFPMRGPGGYPTPSSNNGDTWCVFFCLL